MIMRRKRNQQELSTAGFTLLELVVSLGLMAVVMAISYSALSQLVTSKETLDDGSDMNAVASALLTRLTHELQLANGQTALMPPRDNLNFRYPARVVLTGASEKENGADQSKITLLALEGGQFIPDGSTRSGLVQITYRVEQPPSEEKISTLYLVRDEVPYIRPFDKAYKKIMTFPVTKQLVSFQVRYFSTADQQWTENWGEDRLVGLPNIVEFSITLQSPRGNNKTFTTAVALRAK